MIQKELKKYIEESILPEYEKNEKGHARDHIENVVRRSFEIIKENELTLNENMVYVIACYHDIGHHIDRENHEKVSAQIMGKDEQLKEFFTDEERKIIQEAIEDHRASSKIEPRSIYGKLVSSADRNTSIEQCFYRSYFYGKNRLVGATEEQIFENAYEALKKKFGKDGYAKFFFKDSVYEKFLKEIQDLLEDKSKFILTQKDYIKKIKEGN